MESQELIWELRSSSQYIWLFIPALIALFLVVGIRLIRPYYFTFLLKATLNNSNVLLFAKQDLHTGRLFSYLLLLVNALAFSACLYVLTGDYNSQPLPIVYYFYFILGFLIFFMIKQVTFKVISWLTETQRGIIESRFNLYIFLEVFGVLNLIFVFGILFTKGNLQLFFAQAGVVFQLIIYLYFLLRGIFISIQHKISFLYIFLYLCTLEILPLVVIFYGLSGNFKGLSGL